MRENQILVRASGIQDENCGNHAFFRDNKATIFLKRGKYKTMNDIF